MDLFYLIALFGGGVWGFLFCDWYRAREARKQPATPPVTGHVTHDVARPSHHIDVGAAPYKIPSLGLDTTPLPRVVGATCCACALADYLIVIEACTCECHPLQASIDNLIDLKVAQEAKRANRAIIDGANAHYKRP